jgi:hypothetical protein
MADYRDMAAALSGGYGQDTGPITADTLITLKNGKKATASDLLGMIKGYGQAVGSNLESLGRGGVASVIGAGGDLESFGRMGINKLYGAGGVNVSETSVLPTSTDILGMMPRATTPRQETAGMEELGGYMTPATAKVLKPAVTGYAKLAGQEINAGLTGQPTRSLLGDITPKPKLLDVYHGTPHTLPPTERNPLGEFDASKIGTGEGAQAYGYGIYTAEAPAVAKEYQKQLGTQMKYKGQEFYDPIVGRKTGTTGNTEIDDYLLSYLGDTGVIRKELLNAAKEMRLSKNPQAAKEYQKLMSEFRKVRPDITAANTGNLYKIDLPDEKIATMLDWDKPLSEQPKNVQEALAKYDPDMYSPSGNDYSPEERGQWIYMRLAGNTTQKNASNKLKEMGIPGIKYLDELSRRPGVASMTQAQIDARISSLKKDISSGLGNQERMKQQLASLEQERASHPKLTRNFVVFPGEEKNMTILERNAKKSAK